VDDYFKAQAGSRTLVGILSPDALNDQNRGTTLNVVDQGGEPHTSPKHSGAKVAADLYPPDEYSRRGPGERVSLAPRRLAGGFRNVAVAKDANLQAAALQTTGMAKGEHSFQAASPPWSGLKS